jgi:hypothetical protein
MAVAALLGACTTLQQVAALRRVDFDLDRVTEPRLAGVDVSRVRSYEDLNAAQIAAIGVALAREELPLSFRLHVRATNPADNAVTARLTRMEWELLLEDRETISGVLDQTYQLAPGVPADIPLEIRLDLLDFFDDNARELVDLALAAAGAGGEPTRVALRATPIIDTPLGAIRYPQPITIVNREIGADSR